MMIGRLVFHFGRQHGWDFLVNGNVKDTADYLWFVKDNSGSVFDSAGDFGGFSIPLGADCAIITPSSTDKLRAINFPDHLIEPLNAEIQSLWKVQRFEKLEKVNHCYEWKLNGNPW